MERENGPEFLETDGLLTDICVCSYYILGVHVTIHACDVIGHGLKTVLICDIPAAEFHYSIPIISYSELFTIYICITIVLPILCTFSQ